MNHRVDYQSGIRSDPPPKLETGFTAQPPKPAFRIRPRARWVRPTVISLAIAAAAGLVLAAATGLLRHLLFGFPATPMTVGKANQIVSAAPPLGSTLEEIEVWLPSQGIGPQSKGTMTAYCVCKRGEGVSKPGRIMEAGNKTVAELAGLKTDAVYSVILINYPDADRSFLCKTTITIFLFFDARDRFIGHYVDEDVLMP